MNLSILEKLGLSVNEAKIYVSLVVSGEASISQIAIGAKIHRRNAYDAIHRLLDKGLIFQIIDPRESKYNAVDPDKLKELLAEHAIELDKVLLDLNKQYHRQNISEASYIYRGHEGVKALWREMLRVGGSGITLGAKAQWFDPRLEAARDAFFRAANKQKMDFHLLFDQEMKIKWPTFVDTYPGVMQHRYLPSNYSTNSIIHIFGNYVVTYTGASIGRLADDVVFFVLYSKDLAESYRKWFWYMWDKSESVSLKKDKKK